MADLISRAAAIEHMKSMAGCVACDNYNYVRCRACSWNDAMNTVDELPAVDAVPVVHARWRELKDGTEECTNCLGLCPHEENYNGDVIFNFGCEYCPWCGAKMDGRDEEVKAIGCILVSWFLFYIGVEESPAINNKMLWIIRLLLVFSSAFLALGLAMLVIE